MSELALRAFIAYCQEQQPSPPQRVRQFFEGVVAFPYDNELLLQAYLYLNIATLFPSCQTLLLFEKAPIGDRTDLGKCDLIYLTTDRTLFSIETKYIDTATTGPTERKRRNKHRNQAIAQARDRRDRFLQAWSINPAQITCGIFTTDPEIGTRLENPDIVARYVTLEALHHWQQTYFDH